MKTLLFRLKKRGFTFIEQVVVLVVIAIVAVVAIPATNNVNSSTKVRQAAEVVAKHLQYAQQLAMTTGKAHGVSFNTASETYQVYREDGGEVILDDLLQTDKPLIVDMTKDPYNNVNIVTADFSNGVTTRSKVLFENVAGIPNVDNDGTNPDITSGSVTLSRGGVTRTVTVEPETGKVTIQ